MDVIAKAGTEGGCRRCRSTDRCMEARPRRRSLVCAWAPRRRQRRRSTALAEAEAARHERPCYNISGWKRVREAVRGVVVASRGAERPRGPPWPGEGAGRVWALEGWGKGANQQVPLSKLAPRLPVRVPKWHLLLQKWHLEPRRLRGGRGRPWHNNTYTVDVRSGIGGRRRTVEA